MMFETAFWATECVGIAAGIGVTGWIVRVARREVVADRVRAAGVGIAGKSGKSSMVGDLVAQLRTDDALVVVDDAKQDRSADLAEILKNGRASQEIPIGVDVDGGWIKGREVTWDQDLAFWARWDRPEGDDGRTADLAKVIPFPRATGGDQDGGAA